MQKTPVSLAAVVAAILIATTGIARADVSINSSCFCRITHHAAIAGTS